MNIKETVLRLAAKLPHGFIEGRMPYTYHHDYVRSNIRGMNLSRSDVASMSRDLSEDELYSVAYLYLLSSVGVADIMKVYDENDLLDMRELIMIGEANFQLLKERFE